MLERQEIQTSFPGRTESHSPVSPPKRSEDVEAYMQRRRGLPAFHVLDTSMTLLVKLGLVLDQCCEYSNVARQSLQAQGGNMAGSEVLDQRFGAAHEAIRNSRLMLSQYDERMSRRTHAYDHSNPTDGKRDAMVASVMLRDPLRFAAEVTHHLAVLRAFEGAINLAAPPPPTSQARDMIRNAAIWLSRLADMALEQAPVLFGMPAFCQLPSLSVHDGCCSYSPASPTSFTKTSPQSYLRFESAQHRSRATMFWLEPSLHSRRNATCTGVCASRPSLGRLKPSRSSSRSTRAASRARGPSRSCRHEKRATSRSPRWQLPSKMPRSFSSPPAPTDTRFKDTDEYQEPFHRRQCMDFDCADEAVARADVDRVQRCRGAKLDWPGGRVRRWPCFRRVRPFRERAIGR